MEGTIGDLDAVIIFRTCLMLLEELLQKQMEKTMKRKRKKLSLKVAAIAGRRESMSVELIRAKVTSCIITKMRITRKCQNGEVRLLILCRSLKNHLRALSVNSCAVAVATIRCDIKQKRKTTTLD